MLTSNLKISHNLKVFISHDYQSYVKVAVFDSNNRIVKSKFSDRYENSFSLSQGLYTLRVEMNGEINDEVILLDKDKEYEIADDKYGSGGYRKIIAPPKQFSSVLLADTYGSSHEYYTGPAVDWSSKDTNLLTSTSNTHSGSDSSLFIFMRFPSYERYSVLKDSYTKPFYSDFELVDENGKQVVVFNSQEGIEVDDQNGWVAFSSNLPDGIYYLIYNGKSARQIPIYVFRDWHTQFFLTMGKEPLFGTIRIFLSDQRRFDPYNQTYKHIDLLLSKLQNQDYNLDEDLIHMVADRKYESPMLGLICAYIYLKSKESNKDWLFRLITRNMQTVILKNNVESPDLRAMNILAAEHFPTFTFRKTKVQGTPMFRIGFEAILKASVDNKQLIGQNSINDFISENLYYDSPYNTFKPIPFFKKPHKGIDILLKDTELPRIDYLPHENLISTNIVELNKLEKAFKRVKKVANKLHINIEEEPIGDREIFKIKTDIDKRKKGPRSKKLSMKSDRYSTSINKLYDDTLINFIKNQTDTETLDSWIKVSVSDIVQNNDEVSIKDISNSLGVSGNTISRIFNEWKKEAKYKDGKYT